MMNARLLLLSLVGVREGGGLGMAQLLLAMVLLYHCDLSMLST